MSAGHKWKPLERARMIAPTPAMVQAWAESYGLDMVTALQRAAGHAANLEDAGKAILKEVKKAERDKKAERLARLRKLKESTVTIGPKETAFRAQRAAAPPKKPHALSRRSV